MSFHAVPPLNSLITGSHDNITEQDIQRTPPKRARSSAPQFEFMQQAEEEMIMEDDIGLTTDGISATFEEETNGTASSTPKTENENDFPAPKDPWDAYVELQEKVKKLKLTDEEAEQKLGWEKGTMESLREFRAAAGAPYFAKDTPLEDMLMEDELEMLILQS